MVVDSGFLQRRSVTSGLTISRKLSCFLAIYLCIDSLSEVITQDQGNPYKENDSPSIAIFPRDDDAATMLGTGKYTICRLSLDMSMCNDEIT